MIFEAARKAQALIRGDSCMDEHQQRYGSKNRRYVAACVILGHHCHLVDNTCHLQDNVHSGIYFLRLSFQYIDVM